mmetsp:Transcript_2272/g.4874  ORF Transcript_2272/g.4874 Transcript_2272/m.4874 type:complete len:422 (+) Transcript_2272:380-1645(+)
MRALLFAHRLLAFDVAEYGDDAVVEAPGYHPVRLGPEENLGPDRVPHRDGAAREAAREHVLQGAKGQRQAADAQLARLHQLQLRQARAVRREFGERIVDLRVGKVHDEAARDDGLRVEHVGLVPGALGPERQHRGLVHPVLRHHVHPVRAPLGHHPQHQHRRHHARVGARGGELLARPGGPEADGGGGLAVGGDALVHHELHRLLRRRAALVVEQRHVRRADEPPVRHGVRRHLREARAGGAGRPLRGRDGLRVRPGHPLALVLGPQDPRAAVLLVDGEGHGEILDNLGDLLRRFVVDCGDGGALLLGHALNHVVAARDEPLRVVLPDLAPAAHEHVLGLGLDHLVGPVLLDEAAGRDHHLAGPEDGVRLLGEVGETQADGRGGARGDEDHHVVGEDHPVRIAHDSRGALAVERRTRRFVN